MCSPADDSQSLTYESIIESFVRQKSFKCHYDGCDKGFVNKSQLDSHISRRHAVKDNTQSGEPIDKSSHVRHQSLSAALNGIQQIPVISTSETSQPLTITTITTTSHTFPSITSTSDTKDQSQSSTISTTFPHIITTTTTTSPTVPTITTTTTTFRADSQWVDINNSSADIKGQLLTPSLDVICQTSNATTVVPSLPQTVTTFSADSQLVDITSDNDSDSDIELIGRVPAPKRPARNRSAVDIKPSLIDSIPLVPEIVNKAPLAVITLMSAGDELIRDIASGIRVVNKRKAPVDPRPAPKTTRITAPDLIPLHPCPYVSCRQTFKTRSLLSTHMLSVHNEHWRADQSFPCDKCHLKYSTGLALDSHQELAHPTASPDLIPCPYIVCHLTFTSQSLLSSHLQSVHSNKGWSAGQPTALRCHICQLKYTTLLAFNWHQALTHPKSVSTPVPTPKPIVDEWHHCSYAGCYEKYKTRLLVFIHMQDTHSYGTVNAWSAGERPADGIYLCDKCHLKYRTVLHLRMHQALAHPMAPELNVTNNNTGFTCEKCHKHFNRIVPFMAHECNEQSPVVLPLKAISKPTPTSGRHIPCDACGKFQSLTYESIIESFVRQKSFKCHYDGCDKGFATQSRLDSHISRRHAIDSSAQFGEPIGGSSHVRHQSLSVALDGIQQIPVINTADTSPPLTITTTTTTSSAGRQSVDNTCDTTSPDGHQLRPTNTTTSPTLPLITSTFDTKDQSQSSTISTTFPSFPHTITTTTATSSADRQWVDIKYNNNSSADIKGQPLTPSLDVINQTSNATTVVPSLPQTVITSSADSQLVDISSDNDSDFDIELIGRVPAPKRPARNRSPVDIKPSLIDSIPLVPEIVNKEPEAVITLTGAGNELIRDIAPGIRVVKKRKAPADPRLAPKTTRTRAPDLIPRHLCPYMGCLQTFRTKSLLSAHQALAHPKPTTTEKPSPDLMTCPFIVCLQTFTSQSLLSTHLQSVHSNEQWSAGQPAVLLCHICGLKYTTLMALNRHQASAHPKPVSPVSTPVPTPNPIMDEYHHCPYVGCNEKYKTRLLVFIHMQNTHSYGTVNEWAACDLPAATYMCDKCDLKYRLLLHIRVHRALAHPMAPELYESGFTCEKCHKRFNRIMPFMVHECNERPPPVRPLKAKPKPKPKPNLGRHIPCDACGKLFGSDSALENHKKDKKH
ncbi:unnamed protein product [Medioppia subpectinata]|uniref:C2H2-type domain-containing protein n=1 Tax=Medioppia subpectinata TaxID=1979941 RepID=A0A7R9KK04_9ACAR|nr:unnamed protein product [Medioppia subpectinata]CAG2104970.1 unnamed protein product [Medioppia subpectinata]